LRADAAGAVYDTRVKACDWPAHSGVTAVMVAVPVGPSNVCW
jgi:hypothetical protein